MTGGGLLVLLGVGRMLDYLGFAVMAGLLSAAAFGLSPTGPAAGASRRLLSAGLLVLALGTGLGLVGAFGLITVGQSGAPVDLIGGAALARLAVLAAAFFLLPDLDSIRTPAARFAVLLVVGALTVSLVVAGPLIRGPHWVVAAAAAAWQLVGLAALTGSGLAVLLGDRPTGRAGTRRQTWLPARFVVRTASVVVGVAAVADLAASLGSGRGPGSAVVVLVGLAVVVVLVLLGTRPGVAPGSASAAASAATPAAGSSRPPGSALLATGLSVIAVLLAVSSWLPDQIV